MRLIERPGRIVEGSIRLAGRDLLAMSDEEMRDVRGNAISMIFQEPMTSLNPVYTCGDQIAEAISLHEGIPRREASDRAVEMLGQVGIPDAEAPGPRVPAPALGRDAPAGHDRHGPLAPTPSCSSPTSRRRPSTSRSRPRSWS